MEDLRGGAFRIARPARRPRPRDLRRFGLTMIALFGTWGALLWFAPWPVGWNPHPVAGAALWAIGGAAGIAGITGTRLALPFYRAWTGLTCAVGAALGLGALAIIYYGVVTPLAVIMRCVGRDRLALRRRSAETYWVDAPPPGKRASYQRQF